MDQQPKQASALGTTPLVVVNWEYVEPAARELFVIWFERHDLKWARHAWARLDKVSQPEQDSGEQIANSFILLIGLAMLSSAFWDASHDEPGQHPRYTATDALTALGLDHFYIGQLWPYAAPTNGGGLPDLNEVLCSLAETEAQRYAREVLDKMGPGEVVEFFERVPVGRGEDTPTTSRRVRFDESGDWENDLDLPEGVASEILVRDQSAVASWVLSGFPV